MELNLVPLRKAKGLSQAQVATNLGISRKAYGQMERNEIGSFNRSHLEALRKLFGCNTGQLFADHEPGEAAQRLKDVTAAIDRLAAVLR